MFFFVLNNLSLDLIIGQLQRFLEMMAILACKDVCPRQMQLNFYDFFFNVDTTIF